MITALWIIAICEIVRTAQLTLELISIIRDRGKRDNAYSEFVKSLKQSDKEFVRNLLDEFERGETE